MMDPMNLFRAAALLLLTATALLMWAAYQLLEVIT